MGGRDLQGPSACGGAARLPRLPVNLCADAIAAPGRVIECTRSVAA
jgi:hypothetical protein